MLMNDETEEPKELYTQHALKGVHIYSRTGRGCRKTYTWILNTVSNGRDEQVLSCAPCIVYHKPNICITC